MRNWVLWRYIQREGKWTKKPFQVNGRAAEADEPETWNTLRAVWAAYQAGGYDGIGFEFGGSGLSGVDLDNHRDAETGDLDEYAQRIIAMFPGAFTEPSPSGAGVHIITAGVVPASFNDRKTGTEAYSDGRFFTMMGDPFLDSGDGSTDNTEALKRLYDELRPPKPKAKRTVSSRHDLLSDDNDLLAKAFTAKNGDKIRALYEGNRLGMGNSESDAALEWGLSFYTPRPDQLERLMRSSGLYRDKWDTMRGAETWIARDCRLAIEGRTEFYGDRPTIEIVVDGNPITVHPLSTQQKKVPDPPDTQSEEWEENGSPQKEQRPTIVLTNRQDRDIAADVWSAVLSANDPPFLFSMGDGIARIARDADTERRIVRRVSERGLLYQMRRHADYVTLKWVKESASWQMMNAPAPGAIAVDMMDATEEIEKLPPLRGIYYSPVVNRAGEIASTPGYHRGMGLYLATHALGCCAPKGSTKQAAQDAYDRLFGEGGVFGEFPFSGDASRPHALALLLTPFLRPYINGCSPMFLIEAPERGTGKSLLARNLLRLIDSAPKAWDTPTARDKDNEAEWNKLLSTALQGQPSTLFLDNIRGYFASTTLETILTSPDSTGLRLLGSSTEVTVHSKLLTIVGTSNNAEIGRDMIRRTVSIRIVADQGQPETRTGFRIPDLDRYVFENRADIISDILTILSAWIAAGRPEYKTRVKGGFEQWTLTLGGILAFLGVDGFLSDEDTRTAVADPQTAQWEQFMLAWAETGTVDRYNKEIPKLGYEPKTAAEVLELAQVCEIIAPGAGSKSLGRVLTANRDRVFGDYRLIADRDSHTKSWKYRASKCGGSTPKSDESAGFAGLGGVFNTQTQAGKSKQGDSVRDNAGIGEDTKYPQNTANTANSPGDDFPDPWADGGEGIE